MAQPFKKLSTPAKQYLERSKLDEVEFIMADLPRINRGKAVPVAKFAKQTSFYMPDSIFFNLSTAIGGLQTKKKILLNRI